MQVGELGNRNAYLLICITKFSFFIKKAKKKHIPLQSSDIFLAVPEAVTFEAI